MYAQIMVKVGHLRPAAIAMVIGLERPSTAEDRTDKLFSRANFRF